MISFYYGEQNHTKLKKLIRIRLEIIGTVAAAALIVSLLVTKPLVSVFTRPDTKHRMFIRYKSNQKHRLISKLMPVFFLVFLPS